MEQTSWFGPSGAQLTWLLLEKENEMNTYQSRFGFHPCDRDTFLKIKELRKAYFEALHDFHKWYRWSRKRPENRKGVEPVYCPIFVDNKVWRRETTKNDGTTRVTWFPKTVVDHGVVEMYRQARMPQSQPVELFSQEQIDFINQLYLRHRKWQAEIPLAKAS